MNDFNNISVLRMLFTIHYQTSISGLLDLGLEYSQISKLISYFLENGLVEESKEEELMGEILPMITSFGVPFLEDRNQLDKFLLKYGKVGLGDNPHIVEGICYSHVLNGDYPKAQIMLSSFTKVLKKEIEKSPKTAWLVDMKDRTQLIFDFLENQNFVSAKEQLDEWRNYSVEKLGISDG